MSRLTIRDATPADLPAVGRLYEASGIDTAGTNTPETLAAAWQRLHELAPQARVLIAEEDGQAVGTLTFFVLPMLAHGGTAAALVEAVAVDEQAQGRGVGRALMDEAMARARDSGCYKLALSSNTKRESAHAFYTRLGYQRHGVSFVAAVQEKAR
ncbi:MAG TPA: GNAT family N-acetyltransferase [Albitalea sp.]|nr:GNAT family N-acetyltransferase [Albitalea sp.]